MNDLLRLGTDAADSTRPETRRAFAAALRAACRLRRLDTRRLAAMTGIALETVAMIKAGATHPERREVFLLWTSLQPLASRAA